MKKWINLFILCITMQVAAQDYTQVYLTGSATPNGWTNTNPSVMTEALSNDESAVFTWTGTLSAGEFKFINAPNAWQPSFNASTANEAVVLGQAHAIAYNEAGNDHKFTIAAAGYYSMAVDLKKQTMVVVETPADLWITGTAIPGSTAKLSVASDGKFMYAGALLAGNYRIATTETSGADTRYIVPTDANADPSGETTFLITTDATAPGWQVTSAEQAYKIKLDFALQTSRAGVHSSPGTLYLVGGVTEAGWKAAQAIPFVRDAENPNVFVFDGTLAIHPQHVESNLFKILGQTDWSPYSLHPYLPGEAILKTQHVRINTGSGKDGKWSIDPSWQGRYIITVDLLHETIHAQYADESRQAFLFDDHSAVFYPAAFDSAGTLPSFAVRRDLTFRENLPVEWEIKPVYGTTSDGKAMVTIAFDPDADLYGTGLVTGSMRRNGTHINIYNNDNYAYGKDNGQSLYQSHPWIMGVRRDGTAFGIIADHSWKQYFDLWNPIVITSEGPPFRVIVLERETPAEMMKALGELTGTIELPPLWALGYQQSRYDPSYAPEAKVKALADEFRRRNLPCDVIWMDINYMDNYKVFTFNAGDFPNPAGLNDYLHDRKFKGGYITDPGVKIDNDYSVYQSGMAGDHWVKDASRNNFHGEVWAGDSHFPDFTRPETRNWWASLYGAFVKENHIDGAWNDMNEPGVFQTAEWTMPADNIHRGGGGWPEGSHLRYHNLYGSLMTQATFEGLIEAEPDKRPFVLSRANHLGAQRYCATWTGDNRGTYDHLRLSVPMSITLGLSGQPFSGPDLGGYSESATPDLLSHWMAVGAFMPFSRNHTGNVQRQEPWVFGADVEKVSRTAINRRYRLLPYMYTLFREAATTGMPVMRPVFFADLNDSNLRSEEQAFLVGNDLLVIPRWARNVRLPQGDWDRFTLEEDADDGYQPYLAVRPGAIVPVGKVIQSTGDYATDSVTLLINPLQDGAVAEGTLYDDAGNGFGYRNGDYELVRFTASAASATQLKVEIVHADGSWNKTRVYRIGYVTGNEVVYAPWSSNTTQYAEIIPDTQPALDLSQLGGMYVMGSFNEWSAAQNAYMQRNGDGLFVSQPLRMPAGENRLKFADRGDWSGDDWGGASGLQGTARRTTGESSEHLFFVLEAEGNYVVTFNPSTLAYAITETHRSSQAEIYVAGTFNDWLLSAGRMTLTGENLWTLPQVWLPQGDHRLKFANTANWSGSDWGGASGLLGTVQADGDDVTFTVDATGYYTIRFNDATLEYSIGSASTSLPKIGAGAGGQIYPNPAADVLNVRLNGNRGRVEIFNPAGRKVLTQPVDRPLTAINIASLEPGVYFVSILSDAGVNTWKLLKK
jgi:alpha-glucosidase